MPWRLTLHKQIVSTWPKLTSTSVSISVCMYKYARMYKCVYISRRVARFPSRKSTKLRKSNSRTYHTLASNKCVPRSSLRARVWGSRLLDKGSEEGWPMGWTIGCSVCEVQMKFMLCALCCHVILMCVWGMWWLATLLRRCCWHQHESHIYLHMNIQIYKYTYIDVYVRVYLHVSSF